MRTILFTGVFALAVAGVGAAQAQSSDSCTTFKWSIQRERQAFAGSELPTVKSGGQYPGMLAGVNVALEPQASVSYALPPDRAPKANPAYGAVLTAPPIAAAGTYQVTLSEDAWVDVVQNGAKVHQVGYAGRQGCLNVRKSVKFPLKPGPFTIELSNSDKPTLKLDVLPVE